MKLSPFWENDMRITRKKLKQNGSKVKSVPESRVALQEYLDKKTKESDTSEAKLLEKS